MDLVNTGTDPWIVECEACEVLNRDILEQLNQRNNEILSSREYDALSARIRNRLKQFTVQVEQLKKRLQMASVVSSITTQEAERRKRQVEGLEANIMKLQDQFNKGNFKSSTSKMNEDRSQFLSGKSKSDFADMGTISWGDVGAGASSEIKEMQQASLKDVEQLRNDQQKMLKDQDEGLESLSKIISRQKQIATTINVEVNQQNDLLDDISEDMSRVEGRIQRETNMVRVISRKDRTWGLRVPENPTRRLRN